MKFLNRLRQIYSRKADRLIFATLFIGIAFLVLQSISSTTPVVPPPSVEADTVIPAGFSLVPIELENHEALDSLIGIHAIVNLYQSSSLGDQRGRLIGRNLRLLRAPLNPQKFAVLVPSAEVGLFMSGGRFFASIQNRNQTFATEMEQARSRKAIEYYSGDEP